jgi:glutaredoxin 3
MEEQYNMKTVKIYSTPVCPYCMRAKELLKSLDIPFEDTDVTANPEVRDKLIAETGHMTVPLIFIGDEFIGGYDDLHALHQKGELEAKVKE